MKIGINASFLRKPSTGIGQYTLHLLRAIFQLESAWEHEFFLYYEDKKSMETKLLSYPLKPGTAPKIKKKFLATPVYQRDDLVRKTAWERLILPRQAKKDGVELFFTPFNSATSFPLIPHVMTLHDMIWKVYEKEYLNNFRKNLYSKQTFEAIRRARQIITVSEYSKKEIIKYLGLDPMYISVIRHGITKELKPVTDQGKLRKGLKRLKIKDPYLLYLGGFEKRKNVPLLLKTMKTLGSIYANILQDRKLVIAGKLWEKEDPLVTNVKKLVAELGIEDKVILLGEVADKDRALLYSGCDIFIFPSFYEGFGLPVVEAMACGAPVLASNRTSIPEIGQDAIEYFNPDRQDELVQHLNRLLQDETLREELSRKSLERAQSFSWETAARKTLEVFLKNFN